MSLITLLFCEDDVEGWMICIMWFRNSVSFRGYACIIHELARLQYGRLLFLWSNGNLKLLQLLCLNEMTESSNFYCIWLFVEINSFNFYALLSWVNLWNLIMRNAASSLPPHLCYLLNYSAFYFYWWIFLRCLRLQNGFPSGCNMLSSNLMPSIYVVLFRYAFLYQLSIRNIF